MSAVLTTCNRILIEIWVRAQLRIQDRLYHIPKNETPLQLQYQSDENSPISKNAKHRIQK